jgi:hypothetical protein
MTATNSEGFAYVCSASADVPTDQYAHEATPACGSCFTNPNSPLPLAKAIGSTCIGLLFHLSVFWEDLFFSEIPTTQRGQTQLASITQ